MKVNWACVVIQVLISTFSVCLAVPGRPCGGGTAAVGQRRAGQHASRFLRVTPYPCSLWRTRGAGSLTDRERSQLGGGVWTDRYLNLLRSQCAFEIGSGNIIWYWHLTDIYETNYTLKTKIGGSKKPKLLVFHCCYLKLTEHQKMTIWQLTLIILFFCCCFFSSLPSTPQSVNSVNHSAPLKRIVGSDFPFSLRHKD